MMAGWVSSEKISDNGLLAGLKEVVVDCVGENCCAKSGCGEEFASISIFVASGEK